MKVCICNEIESESIPSNPSTFSIPHVNSFFQITINEFLGRFNENFIKLDRLSSGSYKEIVY